MSNATPTLLGVSAFCSDGHPSAVVAVSLCELYLELDRCGEVIELTNGITNDTDASALLLTYRGLY